MEWKAKKKKNYKVQHKGQSNRKGQTKKIKEKYTVITRDRFSKNYITNATIVYLYFKAMP